MTAIAMIIAISGLSQPAVEAQTKPKTKKLKNSGNCKKRQNSKVMIPHSAKTISRFSCVTSPTSSESTAQLRS